MLIHNVTVTNWTAPKEQWWIQVENNPDQPLINASIQLTLSSNEYQSLLQQDRISRGMPATVNLSPPEPDPKKI